jgi:hypothetical protein
LDSTPVPWAWALPSAPKEIPTAKAAKRNVVFIKFLP